MLLLSSCALLFLSAPFAVPPPVFEGLEKIHGISFTVPSRPVAPMVFQPIRELGSNWVCLMPCAFMQPAESARLYFESPRQWWGERREGIIACQQFPLWIFWQWAKVGAKPNPARGTLTMAQRKGQNKPLLGVF